MSDIVVGASLQVESGQAEQSVKSFRQQLKEAQQDLIGVSDKFGLTSKEATNAARKVADLKDQMGDAKQLVEAFNPDRKFAAFSIAVRGVTNGFTAMQGVMGLVGSESEELQKTLLKVQSALALSEGINGLMEMKDGFKIVQNVAVQGFQKIKAAIGSTGIGLLVIAIGSLVAYWDDIKAAVSGVTEEQKKLNAESDAGLKAAHEKTEALNLQENSLRLQGKTEREILQMKKQAVKEEIDAAVRAAERAAFTAQTQLEAGKRNREILKGALDFVGGGINILLKGVDAIGKVFGKNWGLSDKLNNWIADQFFDVKEIEQKGTDAVDAANKKVQELINQRDGYQLSIQKIDNEAHQKQLAAIKEKHDKELKLAEQLKKQRASLDAQMKAQDAAPIEAPIEEPKQEETGKTVFGELSPEEWEKKNALIRSLTQSASAIKLQDLKTEYERELELVKDNKDAKEALDKKYAKAQKKIKDEDKESEWELQKAKLDMASNFIGQASSLFGKHTVAYKALATTQAIIDTYTSAVSAYKSMAGIPIVGPGLGAVAAIAAIKMGFDNIKRINATQVPGASGGGSAPSMNMPSAPVLPAPQIQTTNLNPNQVNQIGNAAAGGVGRAYVVSGDIQNAQQRDNRIQQAATLGG